MSTTPTSTKFVFPRWANYLLPVIVIGAVGGMFYLPVAFGFGASPKTLAVGYAPTQPVPYSHALHAGRLGMDCRYCHNTVERTAFAPLPATQTCMNCHTGIKPTSDALKPVHESWNTGKSIPWIKVHDLPDYVYFNHSAHVNHGVGCVECHGRIDRMDVVTQAKPLSMGWCLECHRDPGSHLRPRDVAVTDMNWSREKMSKPESDALSARLLKDYGIRDVAYMQSCYTCHR